MRAAFLPVYRTADATRAFEGMTASMGDDGTGAAGDFARGLDWRGLVLLSVRWDQGSPYQAGRGVACCYSGVS
jgi:hypothetical protein